MHNSWSTKRRKREKEEVGPDAYEQLPPQGGLIVSHEVSHVSHPRGDDDEETADFSVYDGKSFNSR